jgi:hypothetical protein
MRIEEGKGVIAGDRHALTQWRQRSGGRHTRGKRGGEGL